MIGGRSKTLKLPGYAKGIDLGPHEYFCESVHKNLVYELKQYGLSYSTYDIEKTIWSLGDRSFGSLSEGNQPVQEKFQEEYKACINEIVKDIERIDFYNGYDPGDEEDLDMSFEDYLTTRIKAKGVVKSLLLASNCLDGICPK